MLPEPNRTSGGSGGPTYLNISIFLALGLGLKLRRKGYENLGIYALLIILNNKTIKVRICMIIKYNN